MGELAKSATDSNFKKAVEHMPKVLATYDDVCNKVDNAIFSPKDAGCWCCATFEGKDKCQWTPTRTNFPFNECDAAWIKNVAKFQPCNPVRGQACNLCWYGSENAGGHWHP